MSSTHYRQQKVGRNFETAVRRSLMTRTALAKKLGVHQSSFTYWYKRGVTEPYAQKTADILGINVHDILSTHSRKSWKTGKSKMIQGVGKELCGDLFEVRADNDFPIASIHPVTEYDRQLKTRTNPEPRSVNIELLTMVAQMRLSAQQEATLHTLALTFLGEES